MSNRSVTIELDRDEAELLLMAVSLVRNSPEMQRYNLDAVLESVSRQARGDGGESNGTE